MAVNVITDDSWSRLERRISKLEDAMGANKLTPQELSKAIHELLDLRQSFYTQMDTRPKIQEGLRKCTDHTLLKMAEEQEGSSKFTTGFKSEILLNDLPRLRSLASSTESLRQLESVVLDVQGPSNDLKQRTANLAKTKSELINLLKKVEKTERLHAALTNAETTAISLTEEKFLEIDDRLS